MIQLFGLTIMTNDEYREHCEDKESLTTDNKRLDFCLRKANEDIRRISEEMSAKVAECQVGAWCKGCAHLGYAHNWTNAFPTRYGEYAGESTYYYCKKHLHDICPEFCKGSQSDL